MQSYFHTPFCGLYKSRICCYISTVDVTSL